MSRIMICGITLLVVLPLVLSGESPVRRLRYIDAYDRDWTSYETWQSRIKREEFALGKADARRAWGARNPMVDVVVYAPLYAYIADSMNVYLNDLVAEGYDVRVDTMRGSNAAQLRSHFASLVDSELVGALLVGNVPLAWYEVESAEGREEFPIELYFMDLNGVWQDTNSNGLFEGHTGNKSPEIWVGRLYSGSFTWLNEIGLINNYFHKNHKYRTGGYTISTKALSYVDDDWYSFDDCELRRLYDTVLVVRNNNTTTAADFRNRLDDMYEWVQICSHSSPWGNTFKNNSGYAGTVFNFEVWFADPPFLFVNLFQCSGTRFIEENSEGACYVFGTTHGLLAVGSTKVGSMLNFEDFYGPLDNGISVGDAFKSWMDDWGITDVDWFYGMCVLGDPTLKPKHPHSYQVARPKRPENYGSRFSWSTPEAVDSHTESDGYAAAAIDAAGRVWASWVTGRSTTNGRTEICARYKLGAAWSAATIIDPFTYWDFSPAMTIDNNGSAWLAWSRCYGRNYDIFSSRYSGSAWGTPFHVSSKATNDMYPAMATDGGNRVWVIYERWNHLNGDIYCRFYDGAAWQPTFAVTTDAANDYRPAIAVDAAGIAWVVWTSERYQYNRNIYVKSYDPSAGSWENLHRITSNPEQDQDPRVCIDGDGQVWVAWTTWRHGNSDIYESHFDGATWSNPRPVTGDSSRDEHCTLVTDRDGFVWCLWQTDRTGNWEIMAKYYKDGAWRDSAVVSAHTAKDILPTAVSNDSGYIWVMWQTDRAANWDIYASRIFTDLVDPQVSVIKPNGGEVWSIGDTDTIRWTATDNVTLDSVALEYSTDNGAAWIYLASPAVGETLYEWLVPATPSNECLVRVRAKDGENNWGTDVSDQVFSIVDAEAPTVAVLEPNGGEIWFHDEIHQVRWVAQDNIGIDSINVELSWDGGATYPLVICHITGNDSVFDWTIPAIVSDSCLVRITGYDNAGNTGNDFSDSLFTLGEYGISESGALPKRFALEYASANPFRRSLSVRILVPKPRRVFAGVYDISGKSVGTIVDDELAPGVYVFHWRDDGIAAGVYFVKVRAGDWTEVRKAVLLK